MNAITHPTQHHAGAIVTGIAGTLAAAAVATVLALAMSGEGAATHEPPSGGVTTIQGSTRDRADVPGPCFARPARWNDDVAGPVPTCGP